MSLSLDRCTALLGEANVKAFLHVIREGESSQEDDAYTIINGGTHFSAPPWHHPYFGLPTTRGARACGAYQFLGTTWAEVAVALRLDDFSPAAQDVGAVYLMDRRGAIQAVLQGDVRLACHLLRDEWVALATMPLERARGVFTRFGGKLAAQNGAGAPQTVPEPSTLQPQPETPVAPDLPPSRPSAPQEPPAMPIPAIAGLALTLLPEVLKLFAPKAQARLQKVTGADQATVEAFTTEVFTKAGQVLGVPNPTAQPVQVVAAAQVAAQTEPAKVAEIEAHALDYLDKLAPLFDRLAEQDRATNAALREGRDAAAARARTDTYDVAPLMVRNVSNMTWVILGGLMAALIGTIVLAYWEQELADKMFVGLVGLAGALFSQVMKERGAIIAYRFDGTPSTNATVAINAELAKITRETKQESGK